MLQFAVELCLIARNVAHLSALVTRQAGKVRRYKNGCSVGVYLRRWSELVCLCRYLSASEGQAGGRQVSDIEGFILKRTHAARTNNKQVRLRRISAFLPEASLRVQSGGSL